MKTTEIDLALPFEQILAKVFSLPLGCANVRIEPFDDEAGFKQVIRGLYEAANGRQVETPLGFIAIAPPVAPSLKAQPFQAATRLALAVGAPTRRLGGPAGCAPHPGWVRYRGGWVPVFLAGTTGQSTQAGAAPHCGQNYATGPASTAGLPTPGRPTIPDPRFQTHLEPSDYAHTSPATG